MLPFLVDKNWYERYWYGEPEPARPRLLLPILTAAAMRARDGARLIVAALIVAAARSTSAFDASRGPSGFGRPVRLVGARIPRRRYRGLSGE